MANTRRVADTALRYHRKRSSKDADKAAAKHCEAKKAGLQPVQHQLSTLAQLAKVRAKKGTDLGVFARNHKLTVTLDEDDEAVAIPGTNGEIVRHPIYGLSLNFAGPVGDLGTSGYVN